MMVSLSSLRVSLLFILAAIALPAPLAAQSCETHLQFNYDSQGNLIRVQADCFGSCTGSESCELNISGDFAWCHCAPSGEVAECVGVVTPNGLRCIKQGCDDACVEMSLSWTVPETGEQREKFWCECQ